MKGFEVSPGAIKQWKKEGPLNFYALFKFGFLRPARDPKTNKAVEIQFGVLDQWGAIVQGQMNAEKTMAHGVARVIWGGGTIEEGQFVNGQSTGW